jgi:hypothetical protein
MDDHYNFGYGAQSGASYAPADMTGQQQAAHGHAAAAADDRKPYSMSPGPGFAAPAGAKLAANATPSTTRLFAQPDGSFKEWNTLGQDQPGKDHPFMIKTSRFTCSDGSTLINRSEFHWTIRPSKDGKSRMVDYRMTRDQHIYDRSGRETLSTRQGTFAGTFKNDGQALPFEKPVHGELLHTATPSDDEQSKQRNSHLRAWRRA